MSADAVGESVIEVSSRVLSNLAYAAFCLAAIMAMSPELRWAMLQGLQHHLYLWRLGRHEMRKTERREIIKGILRKIPDPPAQEEG